MAKRLSEPQSLQLSTLSGTFEAARAVLRCVPIERIGTYSQLSRELIRLSRDKDMIKLLHNALDNLDRESRQLGATTLVKAADHPLFVRKDYIPKDRG
jgi:hypothetical protein